MAENSKIEWTDHTFNPWIGCQKVGPGCDHCYAEIWDARGMQGGPTRWGPHVARTRTSAANWRKPIAWDKGAAAAGRRARVFCASLADVFDNHASIADEWRDDLWRLIEATQRLDWLLLTKRPGNIGNMLPAPLDFEWLYPNVWLGCTVTSREEMLRDAPKLKAVPAVIRFWSVEPLLGDLGEIPSDLMPDWIIVGGESGRHARPMHPDWVRSLRDQCAAAGVPLHFKQWGEWAPTGDWYENYHVSLPVMGWNGERWTDDARTGGEWVARVGKRVAGRLLDGREWNGMPGGANG